MAAPTAGTGSEQDQYWPLPKFYFFKIVAVFVQTLIL
jgi:hypothetical protein